MSAIAPTPPLTASQVDALIGAMPQPATAAPPAVQTDSSKGSAPRFALEDHTHESRLQARRVQLTFSAGGEATWVFPRAYGTGVVPIVEATAETPTAASYKYDVSVRQDSTSNTQVIFILNKVPKTVTVSLLGAVLNLFSTPADTVWIHVMSRAPST